MSFQLRLSETIKINQIAEHFRLSSEYWSIGVMDLKDDEQTNLLHSFNTPSLQYSITPCGMKCQVFNATI